MYPRTFAPLPMPAVIPAPPSTWGIRTLVMPVRWRGSSPPSKTGVTETEQAARSVTHIQYYVDRQREDKLPGVTQASTERGNSSTEPLSSTKDSQSAKYVEKPLRRSQ